MFWYFMCDEKQVEQRKILSQAMLKMNGKKLSAFVCKTVNIAQST